MVTTAQRDHLRNLGLFLVHHAPLIHYAQVRPMSTRHLSLHEAEQTFNHGGHISMDCSEAVTLLFRWAGLRDPNGLGYDGFGNTHEMWAHLPKYEDISRAHTGALVLYGAEGWEHVCMVMSHDDHNPMLFSHGSEVGPLYISLADESAAHQGQPRTFCDISHLV